MIKLEFSSIALEIPIDAYTTLRRKLIGCSTLKLRGVWLIIENNEKAILNINMPYWFILENIEKANMHFNTCPFKFHYASGKLL